MVDRFMLDYRDPYGEDAYMAKTEDGGFVRYRDYAALEAENARLRAEVGRLEDRLNDEVSFGDDDIYDGVKTDTTRVSRYEILLLSTIFLGILMSIYGVAQIV